MIFQDGQPIKNCILCTVCQLTIQTKMSWAFFDGYRCCQTTAEERELVRVGRRHCETFHNDEWMWNFVPASGWTKVESRQPAPLDSMIHKALSHAARHKPIPQKADVNCMWIKFFERIAHAQCRLLVYQETKTDKAKRDRAVVAYGRLFNIALSAEKRMNSPEFHAETEKYGLKRVLNYCELFFQEIGRYKRCSLFVETDLCYEMSVFKDYE